MVVREMNDRTGFVEVAAGVFAFIPEPGGSYGGTNGSFIVADGGVLVIEGFFTRAIAQHVIGEIKRVTSKPIRFVVYTHFHGDHVFGGELFLPAAVVGHKECRQEIIEKWESSVKRYAGGRPELADEFANVRMTLPDVLFGERLVLDLGSHRLELSHLGRAHSKGDIFVHLPKHNVLFTGDVVVNGRTPYTADGYVSSWIDVLDEAQSFAADVWVPGHGPIGDKKTAARLQSFMESVKKQVRDAYTAGASEAEAVKALHVPEYADWQGIQNLVSPVHRLYQEFKGDF